MARVEARRLSVILARLDRSKTVQANRIVRAVHLQAARMEDSGFIGHIPSRKKVVVNLVKVDVDRFDPEYCSRVA